ncbi:uncharacterized protein LOC106133455 [Amyelois transitella]|nr:uncharacterized protein LOC106133455 [Amyelois transitella]
MCNSRTVRELHSRCTHAVTAMVRCAALAQLIQGSYKACARRAICAYSILALTVPFTGSVLSKMSDDTSAFNIIAASLAIILLIKRKKKRQRRWWQNPIFKRKQNIVAELKSHQLSGHYANFLKLSPELYENLLHMLSFKIAKKETHFRLPISVENKLSLTLRFLATGDSYTSLQYLFRISKQSISIIIPEVCLAIIKCLKENVRVPRRPEIWLEVSKGFEDKWHLPHCIGAIDGKHIVIQAPPKSGTEYHNYKSTFSIVLFALVDSDYKFMFADVGCQGRISDGGIFKDTEFYKMMQNGSLNLPQEKALPYRTKAIPYFFVADSAFALDKHVMKPYSGNHSKGTPERIFNYRLSRARRIVESAFGIASSIFRVLRKPMILKPEVAEVVVMSIIHLHNYLKQNATDSYTTNSNMYINQSVPNLTSLSNIQTSQIRYSREINEIRDEIASYCVNEGRIAFQDKYC